MKPEFTKPFAAEHARAGAPYCCRDGNPGEVLKWDANHPVCPLIGTRHYNELAYAKSWTNCGRMFSGHDSDEDLVMTPLGIVQGKPVFVGDEVIINGNKVEALSFWDKTCSWGAMTWPAPAPVYPVTGMTDANIAKILDCFPGSCMPNYRALANAAIKHAIDTGAVTIANVSNSGAEIDRSAERADAVDNGDLAEIAYWNFDARKKGYGEWKGRPQSERDAFKAEYYRFVNADRSARDMAIAEAVRRGFGERYGYWLSLDLAAIIGSVK